MFYVGIKFVTIFISIFLHIFALLHKTSVFLLDLKNYNDDGGWW